MMNKKLIALLIALTTAGIISAYHRDYRDYRDYRDCYVDRHGRTHCGDVVRDVVGEPVRAAGHVAGHTVEAAGDVAGHTVEAAGDVVEGFTAPFRPR